MFYISELRNNIYGVNQYFTMFKSEDYHEANKFFREVKTPNKVYFDDSINGETIAVKN